MRLALAWVEQVLDAAGSGVGRTGSDMAGSWVEGPGGHVQQVVDVAGSGVGATGQV